ncbi:MAG TPA: hypothetical protein VKX17_09825 [Planctomycetota bacterium]|nr:hypothetical protein [Planctomycetota bacterium]
MRSASKMMFGVLFFVLFFGAMLLVTGGQVSPVLFAMPLLLASEVVFMGMMYANIFLDGHEEEEAHEEELKHAHPVNWHTLKPA